MLVYKIFIKIGCTFIDYNCLTFGLMMHPSIYPQFSGDILSRTKLFAWFREFVRNNQIEDGYYMEFGVLNGESIVDMYRQLRGHLTHVYGFDTFEGLPDSSKSDVDENSKSLFPISGDTGTFQTMDIDQVEKFIKLACRIQADKLHLYKGLFSDTLPKFNSSSLSTNGPLLGAYIDCTLYSATKEVLDFLSDKVTTGTWLFFDDYWTFRGSPFHGPQRAINEWLSENPQLGIQDHMNFRGFGKVFIAYEKNV